MTYFLYLGLTCSSFHHQLRTKYQTISLWGTFQIQIRTVEYLLSVVHKYEGTVTLKYQNKAETIARLSFYNKKYETQEMVQFGFSAINNRNP